ncbi:FAD-dependent oxidoreductase [Pseudonocardia eucalypti]|uniref:FAD-dependent oxidoreductase n=1 Tax=Pseudonocardia eucalypti TaxID=648755 RepID=A0ABP9R8V7_9PSEU|nr:glycine cleavage system aminomethyltransferase T/glycine/D-amino acid oxidase-like deaminating enzyme [Pseudonocardia eucalypti]
MVGPKVVIIGAGVVGAALADELAARGWDDITIVDQGRLPEPGGSSSHAPGLVFQTNASKTMADLARYTVDKLCGLDYRGDPCFLQVGGLEVATTGPRLAELHRRAGWAHAWGLDAEVVGPDRCTELVPMLDREQVLGGLHVPTDGLAKAVRAVNAQVERARARGVRVLDRTEVLDVVHHGGRVTGVRTDAGALSADVVVCCAGIWGPKVAGMVGLTLPLVPLAHQLAWTGQVPALAGQREEALRPILRHQEADLYYRERHDTLGIGYYGHRPMPVGVEEILGVEAAEVMPSVQPFTAPDFEEAWRVTRSLLPSTRQAKIEEGINGLFSFTTDDMPLLGESPEVRGFWVAEAVWVTHSAGVGAAMAEWLVDGHCSSFDLHGCELSRFDPHQLAPDYVRGRGCQNFVEVYDIKHPLQPMEEPRPLRTSPFHQRQRELGGYFLEAMGWERPHWYESNAHLVEGRDIPQPDDWAARYWSPIVGAEAQYTREAVAMYDMTALKRLLVSGPGAASFLERMCTGKIDKSVGSVTYTLLLDEAGRVRSDVTVARLSPTEFQVGVNGPLDLDWLRRHVPGDGSASVRDITAGTCCIGLWGPRARDVLAPLTSEDFSNEGLRYFRGKAAYLGNVPVTALRLSYVGELGWEIYTTADLGLKLWDTLWAAGQPHGLIAAGRGAFNSLRLEKGYRSFGTDMTFEHDPWEAGVGFAVKPDKPDFLGRDATLRRRDRVTRKLSCLTLDRTVLGNEPVYSGGTAVGYVTSAAYGYTVGSGVAYAWLPAELAEPGTPVEIGYFDERLPATVAEEPLFDPKMTRLRG